ncbi:asparaginase [Actinokineospora bangkokensis]|uniref:Asparaginase n=1 Tax=Actinokineospora bangkokensis TaxID=1193682 RepID=A0A1Q9LFQ3_9PSEU|nr:asparaginase [Actinokineospora bangkokensis]OLR90858.1 asparaginase [Actinokineospora bangkokensis]
MSEPVDEPNPVLVEVVRSGFTESVHRGSLVVLDPAGRTALALGDVTSPVFPRSSNKPMQALGMLRAGLELDDEADLALVCASHSGEPVHVDRVLALLARHGLTEDDLGCPQDWPLHEDSRGEAQRRVTMNCSGKHAGMLATCVQQGWDTASYLDPAHPLQVVIAKVVEELTGAPIAEVGVDGCGAPLFALSLTDLAGAISRLVTAAPGTDLRRVADAMRAHPHLVAGTGRVDTDLMAAIPGLLVKGGAEGVHIMALPTGTTLALKIDDGAPRARTPLLAAILAALGIDPPPLNTAILGGGEPVGEVRLPDDLIPSALRA